MGNDAHLAWAPVAVVGRDEPGTRRQRGRRRGPDPLSPSALRTRWAVALIVVIWGWTVGPRLLQTLLAPKFRSSVGEESVASPLAVVATLLATLAVLGLCAVVVFVALPYHHPGHLLSLALMLAPWGYLVMRDLFVDQRPTLTTLVYPAVIVAFWILRPKVEVIGTLGYLLGVTVVLNILLGLVLPSKGIFLSAPGEMVLEDKATLPLGILIGVFSHGNTLGAFLALSVPIIAMIPRPWLRWTFLVLALFALFWTASRGAFGAMGVGLIALLAVRFLPPGKRRALTPPVALIPFVAAGLVPFLTDDPTAFTNRGFIWEKSLQWWEWSPWFGLGSDWYNEVGQTSARLASTAFHGHNQLVQLLVTGGLVLLLLVVLLLTGASVRAADFAVRGQGFGIVYLAVLAGCCLLEKPLTMVDNFSMFPVVAVPLAIVMFAERPGEGEPEPGAGPASEPGSARLTARAGTP